MNKMVKEKYKCVATTIKKSIPTSNKGKFLKLKELSKMSHSLYVLYGIVAYIEDHL